MKLNKSVDYTLRSLLYLSSTGEVVTTPVLSEKVMIPYNHLIKLIQRLSKAGIVKTHKGKFGGVELNRSLDLVSVKEVIDLVEGPSHLTVCMESDCNCELSGRCHLKPAVDQMQESLDRYFSEITLEDIVQKKNLQKDIARL